MGPFVTRALRDDEQEWALERIREAWADEIVVGRGRVRKPGELPGLVVEADGDRVGLATYEVEGEICELVTMNAFVPGAGWPLLAAVADAARAAGCARLRVMTTNDNARALRFYQRNGMRLVELRAGAVEEARRLKPAIPETGEDGIPIRDEIDLELPLR